MELMDQYYHHSIEMVRQQNLRSSGCQNIDFHTALSFFICTVPLRFIFLRNGIVCGNPQMRVIFRIYIDENYKEYIYTYCQT